MKITTLALTAQAAPVAECNRWWRCWGGFSGDRGCDWQDLQPIRWRRRRLRACARIYFASSMVLSCSYYAAWAQLWLL